MTKPDGTVVNVSDPAAALDTITGKSDAGGKTQDPLAELAKTPGGAAKPADAKATDTPVSTTAAATVKPEPKPTVAEIKPEPKPEPVKQPETSTETAAESETPKKYNLTLTAKEDVWLRFQTDKDEVKDLILRRNKAITIRANKVIRMFSGNVKAMNGNLNGQALDTLTQGDWKRSVVIPFSEIPNVSLPLFPGAGEGEPRSTAKKDTSSESTSTE